MSALSTPQEQEHHIPSSHAKHSFRTSDSTKTSDEIVVYSLNEHKISYRSRNELTKDDGEPGKLPPPIHSHTIFPLVFSYWMQVRRTNTMNPRLNLNSNTVEGVQATDIPIFKREVDIYLKGNSNGKTTIFYTAVKLPSKVLKHLLRGDYKKLYVCTWIYSQTAITINFRMWL